MCNSCTGGQIVNTAGNCECSKSQTFLDGRCTSCPTGSNPSTCGTTCTCIATHATFSGGKCSW